VTLRITTLHWLQAAIQESQFTDLHPDRLQPDPLSRAQQVVKEVRLTDYPT